MTDEPIGGAALRVALAGQETAGLQALRLLVTAGCEVVTVLADPERRGRGLADSAAAAGIVVRPASDVRSAALAGNLRRAGVDMLLNVHSLHIVHPAVLDAPRLGSFNLHPGPLPEYAGLDAPSWAILHGRKRHAVTLHRMAAGIDTGSVAFTAGFSIADDDTGATLGGRCVRMGMPLIAELVRWQRAGRPVPAMAQDFARRRYLSRRPPEENVVRWTDRARDVAALIRACDYHPWPSPWGPATTTASDGRRLEIVRVTTTGVATDTSPGSVGAGGPDGVAVATGDEWVLVQRLRVGGRRADPAAILRTGDHLLPAAPINPLTPATSGTEAPA